MSELSTLTALAAEVDSGKLKLRVDRKSLDDALKGLQDFIDQLDSLGFDLKTVEQVTGFGGFQMGQDLAAKFTRKGSGDDSIKQRIKEAQDELRAAQELILKAARAYAETDADYADVLGRTEI